MDEYDGRQFVGIDLHRQRSVIVRQSESGEQLSAVRIVNSLTPDLGAVAVLNDPRVVRTSLHAPHCAGEGMTSGRARVDYSSSGRPARHYEGHRGTLGRS